MEKRPFEIHASVQDKYIIEEGGAINARTKIPRSVYGLEEPVVDDRPEAMAKSFLLSHMESFGLSPNFIIDNLVLGHVRHNGSGRVIRLNQYYNNVRVYGSEVAIHINNKNKVTFVSNNLSLADEPDNMEVFIDVDRAESIVFDRVRPSEISHNKKELVLFPIEDQMYLTWRVFFHATFPLGDWEGFVDVQTGELLQLKDIALYYDHDEGHTHKGTGGGWHPPMSTRMMIMMAQGTGYVFDPDPLSSAMATYGDPGFSDNNDANSSELDAQRVSVTLLDITLSGGTYSLVGPWAEIREFGSPNKGLFSQSSSDFSFNREDDAFDAVNTYYHIDASMRYLNITLGLDIRPSAYTGGVRFDPHGVGGSDNSFYSGGGQYLEFGEGCVDDAEDSDVIHHELGHGLHDWVTNGNLSQVEGLSEGSGDYWAGSYNRSLGLWTPADDAYNWIFIWDGHNECWNGRSNDYRPGYPEGLTGGTHTDGQIWSTCMMDVWDEIGQERCDVIFWTGLGMTGGNSNQNDAANAVYQAAVDLDYTFAELSAIHTKLSDCGYTIPCQHCNVDEDGDGFTSENDCNDNDAAINPDAVEIPNNDVDENCDGIIDMIDEDGDGFNSDEDCNDADAAINPDAEEIPNNDVDENCDGIVLVIDEDGDGFNSDEDCNDADAAINPDAEEIPNNDVDENCDGIALVIDEDGDGFNSDDDCNDADTAINPDAVEIPNNDIDENCDGIALVIDEDGDGFNSDDDCNDADAAINPDAVEIPNNDIDENCDGIALVIDEDGDGFNSDEDCNDADAAINPDAIEIPNNDVDENCDGLLDDIDEDGDGFNSDEDCNDADAAINPDAVEIPNNDVDENCDGIALVIDEDGDGFNSDEDCNDNDAAINPDAEEIINNMIDENCDGLSVIIDADGDGFNSDEDCNDNDAAINPDAEEIINNMIDENCDGLSVIIDADGDGFNSDDDCNDIDAAINPDAVEIPNNDVDENCDGIALVIDEDGDGFNSDDDCNDADAAINPDAEEIPNNGIDEDCDGMDLIVNSTSNELLDAIVIYPNPVVDHLYLDGVQSNQVRIDIYDLRGRIIKNNVKLNGNMIDVSDLSSGIFMVRLILVNGQGVRVSMLVKK